MKDKLNNKNIIIIVIVLLLILGIGFSYAWWRYTVIQDKTNVGVSKCFSLELANQANEINLTNMHPITDEEGRKLTPYTFTLKNTCSVSAKYSLNMEMLEGTTLNSNYLAVLVNNKDIKLLSSYNTATTVVKGSTESRTLDTGILAPNGSKDYSISLWMDKSVTLSDDAQNKVFKSKVVVNAAPTNIKAADIAMDKIIASVDTTGKCPTINSDGTVNVTKEEATDGYVCSASDTYGTSYYYRGNVANNYVKFGKWADDAPDVVYGYSETLAGYREYDSMETCQKDLDYNKNCTTINRAGKDMYWRIIRINGDGTVRVIYDGTSAHTNGQSSTDRQIGTSAFNLYWKKDNVQEATNSYVYADNAGVGYMYGNRDAIVEPTEYYSTISFKNTDTYYIAKEYTFDESTRKFTLKNPIAVLGSAMTSDYVGYYTFGNSNASYSSGWELKKIFRVTAGDSSASVKYGYVRYGTSSKEVAQTNTNDSTIKTYLDNWYKTNISGTENEQYLADNIFCNDRSLSISGGPGQGPIAITNNFYSVRRLSSIKPSLGAGTAKTFYNFYDSPSQRKFNLRCPQQNDAFTVSDTKNGNGALRYHVGLINATEVVLAGGGLGADDNVNGYYLYSGSGYLTLTPLFFDGDSSGVIAVSPNGNIFLDYGGGGVRPVLNLSLDVLNNGDGSMNDPYRP